VPSLKVQKFLVPVYLPKWLHQGIRSAKRLFMPPEPVLVDIHGERHIEWSFLSAEMPCGTGFAIDFGCEQGYISLLAARRGYHVIANDLQEQRFLWEHPDVEFLQGDFLTLPLPRDHFDLAINCSSVEHVGVAGRYGIQSSRNQGDIEVMNRLAQILKSSGRLIMTAPCGQDTVMAPWCRVYGAERLPRLFESFIVDKEEFWAKNEANRWVRASRDQALAFQPRYSATNSHGCAYALGCFVLRKRVTP
jgi:SAM-dependent methyltransferase